VNETALAASSILTFEHVFIYFPLLQQQSAAIDAQAPAKKHIYCRRRIGGPRWAAPFPCSAPMLPV
jgi:hypothetical protein